MGSEQPSNVAQASGSGTLGGFVSSGSAPPAFSRASTIDRGPGASTDFRLSGPAWPAFPRATTIDQEAARGSGASRHPRVLSHVATLDQEHVRATADKCQELVDKALGGLITEDDLITELENAGASIQEASDYANQFLQRARDARRPADQDAGDEEDHRDQTGTPGEEDEAQRSAARRAALEKAGWALLRSRMAQSKEGNHQQDGALHGGLDYDIANAFNLPSKPSGSIPESVLSVVPNLRRLSSKVRSDRHLATTQEVKIALNKSEQVRDNIISELQLVQLAEPLPRSIWKKIVQDEFVDFEKLFASMERGYDFKDEPKAFTEDFAIIRKDQALAKRPVRSESEWIRLFGAWEAGVLILYEHRTDELREYRRIVTDLFRAAPSRPSVAIQFDADIRFRYSKCAFHMDDRSRVNVPILSQLFNAAPAYPQKAPKRTSSSPPLVGTKRAEVPCRNWSLGKCKDPCANRRKHGVCCVCGEQHRAKDNDRCLTSLQASLREQST
jgi:hypothetical protein